MGGRRGTGDYAGALIMDDRTLLRLAGIQGQSATTATVHGCICHQTCSARPDWILP